MKFLEAKLIYDKNYTGDHLGWAWSWGLSVKKELFGGGRFAQWLEHSVHNTQVAGLIPMWAIELHPPQL